jgi:hypothetical protein
MRTLRAAHRRYTIEFSAAMLAYMAVLFGSLTLLGRLGDTAWRYPLALSPVLPASPCCWPSYDSSGKWMNYNAVSNWKALPSPLVPVHWRPSPMDFWKVLGSPT